LNLQPVRSNDVPEAGQTVYAVGDTVTPLPKPLSAVTKPLNQLFLQVAHPALMNTSSQHHTRTMVLLLEEKIQTYLRLKFSFDLFPGCLSVMTRLQVGRRFGYRRRQKCLLSKFPDRLSDPPCCFSSGCQKTCTATA
jgi:hypothetical protein